MRHFVNSLDLVVAASTLECEPGIWPGRAREHAAQEGRCKGPEEGDVLEIGVDKKPDGKGRQRDARPHKERHKPWPQVIQPLPEEPSPKKTHSASNPARYGDLRPAIETKLRELLPDACHACLILPYGKDGSFSDINSLDLQSWQLSL